MPLPSASRVSPRLLDFLRRSWLLRIATHCSARASSTGTGYQHGAPADKRDRALVMRATAPHAASRRPLRGAPSVSPRVGRATASRSVMAAAAAKHQLVLRYFPLPGRGEPSRLMLTLAGVPFTDSHVQMGEWFGGGVKSTTPFGQLPLLEVDGQVIAQSAAIDHFVATIAGFIPKSPVAAAIADQAYFFATQDVHAALISPTMKITDPEEQLNARRELAAGPLRDRLRQLDGLVASRPGEWISGDELSVGDVAIFNLLSMLRAGIFWKGIPPEIVSDFPALKEFHRKFASLPAVKAHYAAATDEVRRIGYRPGP